RRTTPPRRGGSGSTVRGRPPPTGRRPARAAPRCWCRRASSRWRWGRARTGPARRRRRPPRSPLPTSLTLGLTLGEELHVVGVDGERPLLPLLLELGGEHLDGPAARGGQHGV